MSEMEIMLLSEQYGNGILTKQVAVGVTFAVYG